MNMHITSSQLSRVIRERLNLNNLIQATFVERPNRFIVHAKDANGLSIRAHLPNPGRLQELFFPGIPLLLSRAPKTLSSSKVPRRTSHTVVGVLRDGFPVFLHTHDTNTLLEILLTHHLVPGLEDYDIVKREAKRGRSRFDFLLAQQNGKELWLEVKSCTLFGNSVAMFPDAITDRGRRHILELSHMSEKGENCAVVFAIQSPHIKWFMPDFHTDLRFSETFMSVKDTLKIIPLAIPWTKELNLRLPLKEASIPWEYLKNEVCDTGTCLLVCRFDEDTKIQSRAGDHEMKSGYYMWSGYEPESLMKLTHTLKTSKATKNLPVYRALARYADKTIVLPIRSPRNESAKIAKDIAHLFPGKGIGDKCQFTKPNPLDVQEFHRFLETYRMKLPVV